MNRLVPLSVFGFLALMVFSEAMRPAVTGQLSGTVFDENGILLAGVVVTLTDAAGEQVYTGFTDAAGRFSIRGVMEGTYGLLVEKRGFYAFRAQAIEVGRSPSEFDITLNHLQEFEETVNVEYSAPRIDRTETAARSVLTAEEIVNLPYPASHDFRNALALLPGTVKDNSGRLHVNGGAENQAHYSLDGFNIASPDSGDLDYRISVDALRAIRMETSRYSAQHGKGSAGILALETSQGDDRFRFSATNFIPSFEIHDGIAVSNWNPRSTISGPIRKGRAWYFNALDLQYDLNIVDSLPSVANTNRNWYGSNLTRTQVNLTRTNRLGVTFLFNFQNSIHAGLTALDPVETTRNRHDRFYFLSLKDQAYLPGGWILETGVALSRLGMRQRPLGEAVYVLSPEGRSGNYFMRSEGTVRRIQGLVHVLAPSFNAHGRHQVEAGLDLNRNLFRRLNRRRAFEIRRSDGTLSRMVRFSGDGDFRRTNFEFTAYVQDRWFPIEALLVETGVRLDWDQVLRQPLWSPRLALAWGPPGMPDTKLSAGTGVFYDATNLRLLTRSLDQSREDLFYGVTGSNLIRGPVRSGYQASENQLRAPFSWNWSLGWEQKLPKAIYLRAGYMRRLGRRGWGYEPEPVVQTGTREEWNYALKMSRNDRYSALELTLSGTYRTRFPWQLSYVRSCAQSSAVLDYDLEDPVLGSQSPGPLPWDAPNRLVSWAFLPVPHFKDYTVAAFLEWHSGFPYSIVSGHQDLIGPPNSQRFPDYFSLNLHVERRFTAWRWQWALRAGFNNITGHRNPTVVNNNQDSPAFGTFDRGQGRAFTGRIRLLGRN